MFGQKDANSTDTSQAPSAPALPTDSSATIITPVTATSVPPVAPPTMPQTDSFGAPIAPQPAAPTSDPLPASVQAPAPAPTPSPAFTMPDITGEPTSIEDLGRMKQDALQHLQPLVGSLQQPPEEEFRTLMMMIQATDDKTLLKKALDAAKKIADDKIRAQAMLDVINEINYFAQTADQE